MRNTVKGQYLASVCAIAMSVGATSAMAQDDEAEDVIVVRGIKGGLADALATKRDAPNIIDSISAEDISELPDQNVAEALQRVTGVSIERTRGEGERVSIRGFDSELNLTLLNGRVFAVGGTGIQDDASPDRSFNFNVLASELVSRLDVIKSPTADLAEGGIGGTVNVHTRRPLDRPGLVIAGTVAGNYNGLADEANPQFSLLASNTFADDTFGILASVAWSQRNIREDNAEVRAGFQDRTVTVRDSLGGAVLDTFDNVAFANLGFLNLFLEDRERFNGVLTAQYEPSDDFEVTFDFIYNRLETFTINHQLALGFERPNVESDGVAALTVDTSIADTDNSILSRRDTGTVTALTQFEGGSSRDNTIDFFNDQLDETFQVGANVRKDIGDLSMTVDVSYSKASGSGGGFNRSIRDLLSPSGRRVEFNNGSDEPFDYFLNEDLNDPAQIGSFDFPSAFQNQVTNRDTSVFAAVWEGDLALDNTGWLKNAKFGLKHLRNKADFSVDSFIAFMQVRAAPRTPTEQSLLSPFPVDDFLSGTSVNLPRAWLVSDTQAAIDFYAQFSPDEFILNPVPSGTNNLQENSWAFYTRLDFEGELGTIPFTANGGVRVVQTTQKIDGLEEIITLAPRTTTGGGFDVFQTPGAPVTFETEYTDVLPSGTITFELMDDLLLRFSGAQVLARAEFGDLTPFQTFNGGASSLSGSGGNTELNPFRADQFDLSLEYYFGDVGAVTVAAFTKDVKSFIVPISQTEVIGDATLSVPFTVERPQNAGTATVRGLEFSYQQAFTFLPGPLGNLGFVGNYTFTDSDTEFLPGLGLTGDFPFPGISDHSFNLIGYYEDNRVNARLAYSYRSEFLLLPNEFGRNAVFERGAGQLDGSAAFTVSDNISVFVEGINLTNTRQRRYSDLVERFRFYGETGRRFVGGVRVNF